MPLGTEVGFGRGDIVFDGDAAPPSHGKGHSIPPTFRPMSVVASGGTYDYTGIHFALARSPS